MFAQATVKAFGVLVRPAPGVRYITADPDGLLQEWKLEPRFVGNTWCGALRMNDSGRTEWATPICKGQYGAKSTLDRFNPKTNIRKINSTFC